MSSGREEGGRADEEVGLVVVMGGVLEIDEGEEVVERRRRECS